MNQVKGKARSILAAVAVLLLGFAASQSAAAQDTTSVVPQEVPVADGPSLDQLIGAIQGTEAQTAALGALTDLTADRVELVSVQGLLQSEDDANALNEALTASSDHVAALQAAVGANQAVQEALGESAFTEDVIAVDVHDDGSVIVFHQ